MDLSEGGQDGHIALMHHLSVHLEEDAINTAVVANSVSLSRDAMNKIATLRKEMYPVCSLYNIDCNLLVEEQELKRCDALAVSVDFVLTDLL